MGLPSRDCLQIHHHNNHKPCWKLLQKLNKLPAFSPASWMAAGHKGSEMTKSTRKQQKKPLHNQDFHLCLHLSASQCDLQKPVNYPICLYMLKDMNSPHCEITAPGTKDCTSTYQQEVLTQIRCVCDRNRGTGRSKLRIKLSFAEVKPVASCTA